MQKILLVLAVMIIGIATYNQAPDTWTRKADFGGGPRIYAVGFSIGSKGYIGTGYDGVANKRDFWEYNPASDTWTQKADFGGTAREAAVGFSIGNKGYIGTGASETNKKDFWEYNPGTNTWTEKADFGGIARYYAVGFSIGNKGYIGTGYGDGFLNDFWEYDPVADIWVQKADYGGTPRRRAVGFGIDTKGYIGTGGMPGNDKSDFWQYDPSANTWMRKSPFAGGAREAAVGFSIGSKGYIGTGFDANGQNTKDFWEYDPATNAWIQKADFGGTGRFGAVGFSIGNKAYIGTDLNFNDFWEYTPEEDTGCQPPSNLKVASISDTAAALKWTLPPGPVNGFDIRYHSVGSTIIRKRHTAGGKSHIIIAGLLPNTIYEWQIRSDCTADTTSWINGPDFTTTSSAIFSLNAAAIKANNVSVQIMPNPNKGNFTLQMQLPAKAALTTLSVYNNLGVMIWQQNAGRLSDSVSSNVELKSKLPAGVYTLMIQYGDTRLLQKFVVTE